MPKTFTEEFAQRLLEIQRQHRPIVIRTTNYYLCIAYGISGVGAGIGIGFWLFA